MHHPKTWFILPTTIYRPNDYIKLGQVITDPTKPFESLAKPLPLKGALKPRMSPERDWSGTNSNKGEAAAGIFAHVLSVIAQASGSQSQNETQTWEAAVLETHFFETGPGPEYDEYVEQTAKQPRVAEWLNKFHHLGKTVYMIAGLKIAKYPGKATYEGSDTANFTANLHATLNPEGAIKAGGEVSHQKGRATTHDAQPDAAFVYAYRLRRLSVAWDRSLKEKGYLKGADLYGVSHGWSDAEEDEESEDDVSGLEISSVSVEQIDFGDSLPARFEKLQAVDEEDNEMCLVIPVAV